MSGLMYRSPYINNKNDCDICYTKNTCLQRKEFLKDCCKVKCYNPKSSKILNSNSSKDKDVIDDPVLDNELDNELDDEIESQEYDPSILNNIFVMAYDSRHMIIYNNIDKIIENQDKARFIKWYTDEVDRKYDEITNMIKELKKHYSYDNNFIVFFSNKKYNILYDMANQSEYESPLRHLIYDYHKRLRYGNDMMNLLYDKELDNRFRELHKLVNSHDIKDNYIKSDCSFHLFNFNTRLKSYNKYYLIDRYNELIAVIVPRFQYDHYYANIYAKIRFDMNIAYDTMKSIGKRYLKLPYTNNNSILINRKRMKICDTQSHNIFYHGTTNIAMKNIIEKGIKLNTMRKHGKRKGKGFYTTKRLDIANGYAESATKKSSSDNNKIKKAIIAFTCEDKNINIDYYHHGNSRNMPHFTEYVFRITAIIDKKIKPLYIIVDSSVKVIS